MSGAVLCAFWCEESGVWRLPFAWLAKSRTQGIIREWFAMTSSMAVDKKEKEYMQILNSLLKSHQITVHGVGLGIFCGSSSYGILGVPSHLLYNALSGWLDEFGSSFKSEHRWNSSTRCLALVNWDNQTSKIDKNSLMIDMILREIFPRQDMTRCFQRVGTAIRIARSLRCRGGRMCKSRKRLDR